MKNIIFSNSAKHLLDGVKKSNILDSHEYNFAEVLPNKDNKFIFPDGETYIRLDMDSIKDNKAVIVFSGQNADNKVNDLLAELEILLHILRGNASSIELIFTYFTYAMQDNVFNEGEANVSKNMIEKYLDYFNVEKITFFDAHCSNKEWFKKIEDKGKIKNIITPITEAFRGKLEKDFGDEAEKFVFIAPDFGAQDRLNIDGFGKKRIDSYNIELKDSSINLENIAGKNICVCDDLIESGGTLAKVALKLKEKKTKKIIAFATHGVLQSGLKRIKEAYDEIYITNTIRQKYANIDICEILANELK